MKIFLAAASIAITILFPGLFTDFGQAQELPQMGGTPAAQSDDQNPSAWRPNSGPVDNGPAASEQGQNAQNSQQNQSGLQTSAPSDNDTTTAHAVPTYSPLNTGTSNAVGEPSPPGASAPQGGSEQTAVPTPLPVEPPPNQPNQIRQGQSLMGATAPPSPTERSGSAASSANGRP